MSSPYPFKATGAEWTSDGGLAGIRRARPLSKPRFCRVQCHFVRGTSVVSISAGSYVSAQYAWSLGASGCCPAPYK